MRRINPIWLLIAFNILFFVVRQWLLPEGAIEQFSTYMETTLTDVGAIGYAGVLCLYVLCAFFFIPLLIPINMLCGAVYGAYAGTIVSIAGITLGSIASTVSVRHVFTGMQRMVDKRPAAQKLLEQVNQRGSMVVILVRLAFVIPYLLQNIVLAATSVGIVRLTLLTLVGTVPSAAIYSFLGAGLMRAENASELGAYLAVPLVLLIVITLALRRFNDRIED